MSVRRGSPGVYSYWNEPSTYCVAFKCLTKNFDLIFHLSLFTGQSEVFPTSDVARLVMPFVVECNETFHKASDLY
jgi:hypothetical protein